MIILDTSFLVAALTDRGAPRSQLWDAVERGDRLLVPALVIYEWLRGPRSDDQLELRQQLFPDEQALPFTTPEAEVAARLYGGVARARGREVDIAIAAHALVREAALWTLNVDDFADLPGLTLASP